MHDTLAESRPAIARHSRRRNQEEIFFSAASASISKYEATLITFMLVRHLYLLAQVVIHILTSLSVDIRGYQPYFN